MFVGEENKVFFYKGVEISCFKNLDSKHRRENPNRYGNSSYHTRFKNLE